ncbi:MAG: hypothetical protein HY775_01670 [Acidobacteria bacterium]|nr:hypothetical protein [Acidobacteriota bacterium]
MRATTEVLHHLASALFVLVGALSVRAWIADRARPRAHLALATGLLGLAQVGNAVSGTVYSQRALIPPRGLSAAVGILLLLSVYYFLQFLGDFVPFPRWVRASVAAITALNLALAAVEKPEYAFVSTELVRFKGVRNLIPYTVALVEGFAWLSVAFGSLCVLFLVYGRRMRGRARFRMLSIGFGSLLLFVGVIIVPLVATRISAGGSSAGMVRAANLVLQLVAVGSAPLLILGFSPPAWVVRGIAQDPSKAP